MRPKPPSKPRNEDLFRSRLDAIVDQLDPERRNVVEFRHASWWQEEVYDAFRKAGFTVR